MSAKTGIVPVLAAPMIDPGKGRIAAEVPYGLTIAQIIAQVMPFQVMQKHLRVALVTPNGSQIVPQDVWGRVLPHPGVHVVIRVVPGKDALKSILSIVVAVAAVALGQYWALPVATTLGVSASTAAGLIGLGVTMVGNLLINALIPPPKPKSDDATQNRYSISGWRNRLDPNGAVPVALGDIRYAAPFGALSWSEIVGDFLYINSLFCFGYGRLLLDDFRIGDTSLSEYNNFTIEVREGVVGEAPISNFAKQRLEEAVGAELTYPYPRDEFGNIVEGSSPEEAPVTRTTGRDASGASIILAWPAGLWRSNRDGDIIPTSVIIDVLQRLAGSEEWQEENTLTISASQRESFYRQYTWDFPQRGRWEVRLVMRTPENSDARAQYRTSWAAFQTIRPEYPLNFSKPLALVGLRMKATHQLNGTLDNFNARCRRVCLDWDHEEEQWLERPTRNPASLKRYVLQSPANPRPVADSGLDLLQLQDWHDYCRLNGLNYDRVQDSASTSLRDVLGEIAAAGRAAPRHDGRKWGVVIDRPRDMLTVAEINPRNSFGFRVSRSYLQRPDGLRVQFQDETNDHKPAERIVPAPWHTGEVKLTEVLELPGITNPERIYIEATRRMLETMHRPDVYYVSQDLPTSPVTRGDKVRLSADTIERTQVAARVRSVAGQLIELDDAVTMEAGGSYAIRFRVFEDAQDTIGTSIVRNVKAAAGETRLLTLSDTGASPIAGSYVHFGVAGKETFELIVTGIEAGQDFSRHLKLIDAAPIIDELLDDLVVPPWSGRVGAEIPENLTAPPAPRFTSIRSGVAGTETSGLITYTLVPGAGPVPTSRYKVAHRAAGAPDWVITTFPAANGGGQITAYANGASVELAAAAISASGVEGPFTATVTFTVGGGDLPVPQALDSSMITVGALLGGAAVQFSTSDDAATKLVQVYRSTSNVLNRTTDAVGDPVAVEASRSYSRPIGDTTRQNLLSNGNFDSASNWTLGSGWAIASGQATKTAGSATNLSQALAAQAGKFYRVGFKVSGMTAGFVLPRLAGGTDRNGAHRTANGTFSDRIQAVSGNNAFAIAASSAFNGSVDDLIVYLETATCLAQGVHYIWLEPQNEDGVPGPVSGPFPVTIR